MSTLNGAVRCGSRMPGPSPWNTTTPGITPRLRSRKKASRLEAKQTLASIMRLSATVGGPEMKQKYKTLLDQIK